MKISPLAGKPAPLGILVNVPRLVTAYYTGMPDPKVPAQRVAFGTSGHRGSSFNLAFNEWHILAITQAICLYRKFKNIVGPLFLGMDTHALSVPACATALEVLAANGIEVMLAEGDEYTPTPVISHAILNYNRGRTTGLADGIVITPSHNPPQDGGFKYNPPNGGPADEDITGWVERRANELLRARCAGVKRMPFTAALTAPTTHREDFIGPYVRDLQNVVDMDVIRAAGLKLAVDPLGGASEPYWEPINSEYHIEIAVVNDRIDPTFSFMTVDHDGVIRMDCSSPYAMERLVELKDRYRLAFGNDPDSDRHGIVTPSAGLMNPNHYLAVAIEYLLSHRDKWPADAAIGKTVVSSSMIDKVVQSLGRRLYETPVGFKYFVDGLASGACCFGGEESAGASFLRRDGSDWTTAKDGIILSLLAAEITATTGKDPSQHYQKLTERFGSPIYTRIDAPATPEQKARLKDLAPEAVKASTLAGEPILAKLTRSPGDNAAIGGLKVTAASGWFAARPSGTENIYKIYAESFRDQTHLNAILAEATDIVGESLGG